MRIIKTILFAVAVMSMAGCSEKAKVEAALQKNMRGENLSTEEYKMVKSYVEKQTKKTFTDAQFKVVLAKMRQPGANL